MHKFGRKRKLALLYIHGTNFIELLKQKPEYELFFDPNVSAKTLTVTKDSQNLNCYVAF